VGEGRFLTTDEIRAADVTDSKRGRAALQARRERETFVDVDRHPYRVYVFGRQDYVVGAATPLRVRQGANARREVVYEIVPLALPAAFESQPGYAGPTGSAWKYNHSAADDETVGTWYRSFEWTMMKANDWKSCTTCTPNDYWRMYGRMRASALTGSAPDEGFRRAWIEFDATSDWSPIAAPFEDDQPGDSYGTSTTQTITVGFGSTFGINIGQAPLTINGTASESYGWTMVRNTENWHPVIRSERGSGGVQWCRYDFQEFTGTIKLSTRVSAKIAANGTNGGWYVLRGQHEDLTRCPNQI
jgi:hypothetical protein